MNRLHKILLGVFCGGVLICGIGPVIEFTEFSELEYGGVKYMGDELMRTERLDVALESQEEIWQIMSYGPDGHQAVLETDESVPEHTVRFQVTYNADRVEPVIDRYQEDSLIELYWSWLRQDEVGLMMEVKDEVLADLKDGKISSYEAKDVEEVKVLIHPADEAMVRMRF